MKIQPINYHSNKNDVSPSHRANLWVCESVKGVIEPNRDVFLKAVDMCDKWLRNEMGHILKTMTIRKNTSLVPRVAFREIEYRTTYAYPHEELGHTDQYMVDRYENLEFEFENRKCGFWFNPKSNEFKLLEDFKNVFNYLANK